MHNPTLTTATANASRQEVVNWFNSLELEIKSKKIKLVTIDQLVDGVPICLFFSKLFPSKYSFAAKSSQNLVLPQLSDLLNEGRIKTDAKFDYERYSNWKLVQNVLDKLNLDKKINIDRVLGGTRTEVLEMAQWMILFYEQNKLGKAGLKQASKETPESPKTREEEQDEIIRYRSWFYTFTINQTSKLKHSLELLLKNVTTTTLNWRILKTR